MAFVPRSEEVQLVVDILTRDDFDTPEQMAKALLKEAVSILSYRDTYALTHRFGGGGFGVNWSPFWGEADAVKAAEKIALNGQFSVVKLHSSGVLLANVTSSRRKGWCQTDGCGHADWMHLMNGTARGKCGLSTCPCGGFTK